MQTGTVFYNLPAGSQHWINVETTLFQRWFSDESRLCFCWAVATQLDCMFLDTAELRDAYADMLRYARQNALKCNRIAHQS